MVNPTSGKRGFWGIGIWHPKYEVNVGTLFRSAHAFGADFLFTIGQRYKKQASDTGDARKHVPLFHYSTIEDLVGHLPHSCPLIAVELAEGAKPIENYVYPERFALLLGAEDHGLPPAILAKCHQTIIIGGATHCLNVAVAGSIIMYDKVMKDVKK